MNTNDPEDLYEIMKHIIEARTLLLYTSFSHKKLKHQNHAINRPGFPLHLLPMIFPLTLCHPW